MCLLTLTRIAHDDSHAGAAQATRGYVRPARSIFSNPLNLCRSAIAALVRSPCRYCPFLSELHALKIDLFLRQQGLDTTTPAGKAMFQMMGVFAEFERAMIQERVRAGLARARGEGKRLGRPPIAPALEKRIREALTTPGRPGVRIIAKQFGVNPGTVQRISRPFEQDAVAL